MLERPALVGFSVNGNLHARLVFALELHVSFDQRKDRVVSSETNILAGMELCAVLLDDDVAGENVLTAEFFHA